MQSRQSRQFTPDRLRRVLVDGRNADGGWGYYRDKATRLEPTAWALMALRPPPSDWAVLRRWPIVRGLLTERADGDPNYAFHALGLLALLSAGLEHDTGNAALCTELVRTKGVFVQASTINRQDNLLLGWSWMEGTFSWVEPTAWCLLALKKWSRLSGHVLDARRREQAESLLIDRCCVAGGWNYGNSNMLGRELTPYVPTTAAALLALQDRSMVPEVAKSHEYLKRSGATERSAIALSLAVVALSIVGGSSAAARAALDEQLTVTESLGNHAALALALFALDPDHGYAAVTL